MASGLFQMKTRKDFPKFLNDRGLVGTGVEVGVFRGGFSKHILKHWDGTLLYSVDPWIHQFDAKLDVSNADQLEQNEHFNVCREALREFKMRSCIVRKTSVDAANVIVDTLDFVYLDARHDYRSVWSDLQVWWPKVRLGGVLAGHDYKNSFVRKNLVEVKRAVDNFFIVEDREVLTTTDDNLPSWVVFK